MTDRTDSPAVAPVSLFDTARQIEPLRQEIEDRIQAVLESGRYVLGPEVDAFEREYAAYLGVEQVVGVANGTDALMIALRALGIERGTDVVVPSFTFYATAEAVVHAGARPVFCDIDPETFCVTAETVERALTPSTRAVIPVHLFGRPAPMTELRALADERGLKLLEDAAQAAGARLDGKRAGALGDAATFSFFPSKNLFCLGDGGAIATDDTAVAERARRLRIRGGSKEKTDFTEVGWNSRLDSIQAAVLRAVLPHLDRGNESRRALAREYEAAGIGDLVSPPAPLARGEQVHHLYVVRSDRRDEAIAALGELGVQARAIYARPVHLQPAMEEFATAIDLPGTKLASATNLALPMGPTHDSQTARYVTEALRQALNSA